MCTSPSGRRELGRHRAGLRRRHRRQLRHRARCRSRPTTRSAPASRPAASDRAGNPIPASSPHPQLRHGHRHLGRHPGHPRSSCTDQTVVPLSVQFSKVITSQPVVAPGGMVSWEIGVGVDATSAGRAGQPGRHRLPATHPRPGEPDRPGRFPQRQPTAELPTADVVHPHAEWLRDQPGAAHLDLDELLGPARCHRHHHLNTTVALDASPASVTNTATLTGANLAAALTRTAPRGHHLLDAAHRREGGEGHARRRASSASRPSGRPSAAASRPTRPSSPTSATCRSPNCRDRHPADPR